MTDPELEAMIAFCRADPEAGARLIIRLRDQHVDEYSSRLRALEAERLRPDESASYLLTPITQEQGDENFRQLNEVVAEYHSQNMIDGHKSKDAE